MNTECVITASIDQHLTAYLRKLVDCQSTIDQWSMEMSIKGIDRHSTADAFSTHDP